MFVFVLDAVLKTYSLRKKYFELPNSHVELASTIAIVCYAVGSWVWTINL